MSIRCTLPVTLVSLLGISTPPPALQPGLYRTESKLVHLARQGDRFCLQGPSAIGIAVASVASNRADKPNVYPVYGLADTGVAQQDAKTLLFGRFTRMDQYVVEPEKTVAASPALAACLSTQEPYFRQLKE